MSKYITITNVLGSFATNCYTVANTETREAVIIDPADRAEYLISMYENQKLQPVAILLTHGHLDHIGAVGGLKQAFPGIKVYAGVEEKDVLARPELNLSNMFGFPVTAEADVYVKDSEKLTLLDAEITCIHVPGHTKGGMCYYFADEEILFSGDTLFCRSVGRSDFPTGDSLLLLQNIEKKLLVLPENVTVYPGHDSRTTIGKEKKENPYF
ncbi:MAG: MBL fold metallo-hydrolase [Lachnospiraceae bacterium]|nr:MBL fold metallo-hydrolase [Lachnospiraceae bacterium]